MLYIQRNSYNGSVGKPEGKKLLEDPGINGILKWVLKAGWDGMAWIHLAQNMNKGQSLMSMVTNFRSS